MRNFLYAVVACVALSLLIKGCLESCIDFDGPTEAERKRRCAEMQAENVRRAQDNADRAAKAQRARKALAAERAALPTMTPGQKCARVVEIMKSGETDRRVYALIYLQTLSDDERKSRECRSADALYTKAERYMERQKAMDARPDPSPTASGFSLEACENLIDAYRQKEGDGSWTQLDLISRARGCLGTYDAASRARYCSTRPGQLSGDLRRIMTSACE